MLRPWSWLGCQPDNGPQHTFQVFLIASPQATNGAARSKPPSFSTFFEESQMTKSRTLAAFAMFVLSAAVAVFSGAIPVPFLNAGKHSLPAIQSNGAVTLIADGGDPQPPPTPLPWLV